MSFTRTEDFAGQTVDTRSLCLRISTLLGRGAFSAVYRAEDILTGTAYAVKCLRPSPNTRPEDLEAFFRAESELHLAVSDHPNILTIHCVTHHEGNYLLVFDFCEGGTLSHTVTTPYFWKNDGRIRHSMLQLLDAVSHCHDRWVAHRDIKPENILMSRDKQTVYLADFGLAHQGEFSSTFCVGSKSYISPESLRPSEETDFVDTFASDVWSLGIVFVEMIVGQPPWVVAYDSDRLYREYLRLRARYFTFYMHLSKDVATLLARVLDPDPILRISLEEFKEELKAVDKFMMTREQLQRASSHAKANYAWQEEQMLAARSSSSSSSFPSLHAGRDSPPSSSVSGLHTSPNSGGMAHFSLFKSKPRIKHVKRSLKAFKFW